MPEFSKVLLIALGTLLVLRAIRGRWMRSQVKKAVRRDHLPPDASVVSLSEEHYFSQDFGSVKDAVRSSYCDRDFVVTYQEPAGTAHKLRIIAVFYPIVGLLRQVVFHSERWETIQGPVSEA